MTKYDSKKWVYRGSKSYSSWLTKNGLRFHIQGVNQLRIPWSNQWLAMPNSARVLADVDADRLTHGCKEERVSSGKCRSTPCDGAHLRHNSLSPNSRNRLLDSVPVKGKLSLSLECKVYQGIPQNCQCLLGDLHCCCQHTAKLNRQRMTKK